MQLDEPLVRGFAALFRGRTDAHGALHGEAIRRPVTLRVFFLHTQGRDSLGIYPLLDDGTCWWGCVDIDHDDVEAARELVASLSALGLNCGVYLERSRSKGWHVWTLFDQPVLAGNLRRVLREGLRLAGLPLSTEVFPKQDRVTPGGLGNYVNLPYFGGDRSDGRRSVVNLGTLEPIPWQRFVHTAQRFPAGLFSLVTDNLPSVTSSKSLPAPGWLPELLASRVEVGARRPSLIRVAGALRSHGIDEESAVMLTKAWAEKAFVEPLDAREQEKHVRGIYQRYGPQHSNVLEQRAFSLARRLGWSHDEHDV